MKIRKKVKIPKRLLAIISLLDHDSLFLWESFAALLAKHWNTSVTPIIKDSFTYPLLVVLFATIAANAPAPMPLSIFTTVKPNVQL